MPDFPFKLAAIDIDDTLVGPDKRVSPANRAAVSRLRSLGCRIVLASGRRHENMLPFYRTLALDDFMISCHGAVARHPRTRQVLHQAPLPAADAAHLASEGIWRGLSVMYWSADGVFAPRHTPWIERYSADCSDQVHIADVRDLAARGVAAEKITFGADPQVIATLKSEMDRRYAGRLTLTITDDWFLEFTSPNATKAAGVAAVARRYGVEPRHVLAFGDGNNDVPMLAWAGLGVAMSHARPAAQSAAKLIAPAGDPDSGLGRAVDGLLAAIGIDGPCKPAGVFSASEYLNWKALP